MGNKLWGVLRSLAWVWFKPVFSLMVHVIGDCTPRRTCGLCQTAIHFEGCGQNSSITLIYWRSRPKSIEQNLVNMSFSLIRLQKENLNAQIGNEKCWRQQRCRKETGTYGRPQIERESRLHRKVIKKAPFILALNGCHWEGVVILLLRWRTGARSGHCA